MRSSARLFCHLGWRSPVFSAWAWESHTSSRRRGGDTLQEEQKQRKYIGRGGREGGRKEGADQRARESARGLAALGVQGGRWLGAGLEAAASGSIEARGMAEEQGEETEPAGAAAIRAQARSATRGEGGLGWAGQVAHLRQERARAGWQAERDRGVLDSRAPNRTIRHNTTQNTIHSPTRPRTGAMGGKSRGRAALRIQRSGPHSSLSVSLSLSLGARLERA